MRRWLVLPFLMACNAILSNEDRTLRADDAAVPDAQGGVDGGGQNDDAALDATSPDADGGVREVQILRTGLMSPQQVFVVAGNLYYSDKVGLGWCPVNDCTAPKPFHTSNNPGAHGLAVDGMGVLVASTNNGFIYQYPLAYDGTGQALIANGVSPAGVALDGANAFFTTTDGSLYRCGRSNNCAGGPTLVARGSAPGGAVAVGTTYAVWASLRVPDGGAGSGHLQQVDKNAVDGGATMKSFGRGPRTLLMAGTRLYWTATDGPAQYDGEVSKRDNALDSVTEEFYALQLKEPWGVAVDATHVYFTIADAQGAVKRCPIAGPFPCQAEDVATGQAYPHGVAVDATHVYWANFGDGTIARVAKP